MRSVSIRSRGGIALSSRLPSIAGAPFDDGKAVENGILLPTALTTCCGEAPKSKPPAASAAVNAPAAVKIEIVDASKLHVVDSPAPPLGEIRFFDGLRQPEPSDVSELLRSSLLDSGRAGTENRQISHITAETERWNSKKARR